MDWETISKFHKSPPTIKILRSPDVQRTYLINKSKSDYVKDLYERIFVGGIDDVLVKNTYPYDFVDKTQHYVYWTKTDIDYNKMEGELDSIGKEYVYFENLRENKSIEEINHVHVFFKD
jgi:hypothetical protein